MSVTCGSCVPTVPSSHCHRHHAGTIKTMHQFQDILYFKNNSPFPNDASVPTSNNLNEVSIIWRIFLHQASTSDYCSRELKGNSKVVLLINSIYTSIGAQILGIDGIFAPPFDTLEWDARTGPAASPFLLVSGI